MGHGGVSHGGPFHAGSDAVAHGGAGGSAEEEAAAEEVDGRPKGPSMLACAEAWPPVSARNWSVSGLSCGATRATVSERRARVRARARGGSAAGRMGAAGGRWVLAPAGASAR